MIPGNYLAKVTSFDFGQSSTGKDFIKCEFTVTDGEYAGRTMSWYGYLSEKTAKRTIESLRHCGWTGDNLAGDMPGLMSQKVSLTVDNETYNGNTRLRVKWVNSSSGSSSGIKKRLTEDQLAQLSAIFGTVISSLPPQTDGIPVEDPPDFSFRADAVDEDDIPF